jgi:phosphoglycolate phosphatase
MLVACQQAGGQADNCLTIGDHQRDIEAANRAGMRSLAACWGYLSDTDTPEKWGATALIQRPVELLDWL